jgi:Na+:H+ antiporter
MARLWPPRTGFDVRTDRPQVVATLAVALVAYATVNASGQRLIDQAMLNTAVVLVIVSSLVSLVLTERARPAA